MVNQADGKSAQEPVARLLSAWRGEVEARAVYEAMAARERDPERAAILWRMAKAEGGHRTRIEARLQELGVGIPDSASQRLSPWTRLQIRFAPVEKVLAWREALENREADDLYGRPTGDPNTDRLLAQLRKDERSHALAAQDMQPDPHTAAVAETPEGHLKRILARETWHRTGSSWISGAVYGANDGLAAVFGIVAGVSGATGGSSFVLTAGLAGAGASALSTAVGAYLAERSTAEVAAANIEGEREEVEEHPDEEREELSLFYQLKGLEKAEADELAEKLGRDPEAMLRTLTNEEIGGVSTGGDPVQEGIAPGVEHGVGGVGLVLSLFLFIGDPAAPWAPLVSLVAHFVVGAAKSLFTLRSWWSSGLEMTGAGVIVGGATYVLGLLVKAAP